MTRYSYLRSAKALFKKIVVDQVLFSPFLIFVFFGTIGILERQSLAEVLDESIEKGKRLYAAEWCIWPPAQFVSITTVIARLSQDFSS
jgi:protein Mpv17